MPNSLSERGNANADWAVTVKFCKAVPSHHFLEKQRIFAVKIVLHGSLRTFC